MKAYHFKKLICGNATRDVLLDFLHAGTWYKGADSGFSIGQFDKKILGGCYVWRETIAVETIDEDSLEVIEKGVRRLQKAHFILSFGESYVRVEKKAHFGILFDALDALKGVHLEFEDYQIDLEGMVSEIQRAWKKNRIESIGIKNYLARENMMTDATFKMLEPTGEKIIEKFDDQVSSVKLLLKLPDGDCPLTVTRDGSIRTSDDAPDDVLMFVRQIMPHHDVPDVETVEVADD